MIERGAEVESLDTYGYRPLHRMASNNLAVGAEALLVAGANPTAKTAQGDTPMMVARQSNARDVIAVLQKYMN
jgi:ankyrin repeat protein